MAVWIGESRTVGRNQEGVKKKKNDSLYQVIGDGDGEK